MDIKTKAFVTVRVEVECGLWGADCRLSQVFTKVVKESVEKVQRLVRESVGMKIVGEPEVTLVTSTK